MAETVLTTGTNSGIGLAVALELARRGFRSVGTVRSEEKAEAVAVAARKANVKVETLILDVTNAARCEEVIAKVRPFGLVNNAGYGSTGAVEDVTDDEARQAFETMVLAPMRLSRLALVAMRERGAGRIVNISSIYGRTTTPLSGWYQACKHALEALSDALRAEVASSGVKVVLVEPGGFKTDIWEASEKMVEARKGSRYETAYRRTAEGVRWTQPLMGDPATVAKVVGDAMTAWFPRARYLVGYDAQILALADRVVPTGLKDWVSRLTLGL